MKINILILFIVTLFLNGCCSIINSCDCDLPDLVQLDEEPKNWLIPYENVEYHIFRDENGNIDSLEIKRSYFTDYIGGDECDSKSESIEIGLQSTKNIDQGINIKANTIYLVSINMQESTEDYIQSTFNTQTKVIRSNEENISDIESIFDTDYFWNNEVTPALIITCDNELECSTYQMQHYVITKKFGLIAYMDSNGTIWEKLN